MLHRALSLCVGALALAVFVASQAPADEPANTKTHEGTVVKTTATKLTMKAKDSEKEHTHTLAPGARVTCDGKACRLSDLKEGQRVRVTTQADNQKIATRVEALDKQRTFSKAGAGSGSESRDR